MSDLHDPSAKVAILARLEGLEPDRPRVWGRMNAHQAVCHLNDSFEWAAGRRDAKPIKGPPIPAIVMKGVALYLPLPWPKGVPTMPEADQMKGGTPPGDFGDDRAQLVELIEEFAAAPEGKRRPPHPIFKSMSRTDWGRWAYRHVDHHLRQFAR